MESTNLPNTDYETITEALTTHGFVVLDNVFDRSLPKDLCLFAKNNAAVFQQAKISNQAEQDLNIRRDKTCWLNEDSAAQSRYLSFMSGLQHYLNQALFLGLTHYESHFSLYEKGDFYRKHLDAFKNNNSRCVTTVYYLNAHWDEADGGVLIVYNKEGQQLHQITPKANRLVVFLSGQFPHEILPPTKSRYAIAGWFRID